MRAFSRRAGWILATAAVACLGSADLAAAPPAALAAAGSGRVALPSPVPAGMTSLTDLGPAGVDVSMPIRVYLTGRSAAAKARFAAAASTPGHPAYGQYLSPAQFRSRFGPTAAQTAAVEAWARSAGLTVTGATSHYVAVTGTAPQVSAALDTSIHSFSSGSTISEYAPAGGMSVPASIGGDVATVTGLERSASQAAAAQRTPGAHMHAAEPGMASAPGGGFTCSNWWGQHVSAIPRADGRTSAPSAVCGYTPQQLRSAYGTGPNSGQGATIAIVLDGSLPTMAADANRFFAAHHVPGLAAGQLTVNTGAGFAASCDGNADVPEEPLDVETAHIIAPAAKIVYVAADCTADTLADNGQQGLLDAETRVVDQHLGDVATESYSVSETQFSPATAAAWTQVLEQGAAEGIGFDFDSGDGGDDAGQGPGGGTAVTFPASDPWATAVGGTAVQIGRTGAVTGELGWGDTGAQENADGTGYTGPTAGHVRGRIDRGTQRTVARARLPAGCRPGLPAHRSRHPAGRPRGARRRGRR